jgi:hypothetical protein
MRVRAFEGPVDAVDDGYPFEGCAPAMLTDRSSD